MVRLAKGAPCCIGGGRCDGEQRGFFFPTCGHWVCTPCGGLSSSLALNYCPERSCDFYKYGNLGHSRTDAGDLRQLANTEIASCASKLDAIERETKADLLAIPDARFVMVAASEDAVRAVCKRLNDSGIPSRALQLGAAGGRTVTLFNSGTIRVRA